jgi:uncharacterized protein YndB with AHSA1/START domain
MGFPDRIERSVEIAHPPRAVWAALTTAERLAAWFGNEATIDLRPGGSARMRWTEGYAVDMRVERVEEPTVFGFTWQIYGLPKDDPRRTYVEFTLEPFGAGTRLTVVESGFAQLPEDAYHKAYHGNVEGWASELGELATYLDARLISRRSPRKSSRPLPTRPAAPSWPRAVRRQPRTWPIGCRSHVRRSQSTWRSWPRPGW